MYGDRRHQVKMPGGLLFFDDKKVIDICSQILYHITHRLDTANQEKRFDERRTE